MSNTKTVLLALVAVVLVLGVCFFISINPWVSAGLAPALLAIAAIVRAVSGGTENTDIETGKNTQDDEAAENEHRMDHNGTKHDDEEKDRDIER